MSEHRKEKVEELIMHLASEFINREANSKSLITVTNIYLSHDFKNCKIFFTVFPENQSVAALDFLKRQRSDFKSFFKSKSKIGHIPFFDFEIDEGEKARQRVEEISLNL
jgi:ribosome-binding factor A